MPVTRPGSTRARGELNGSALVHPLGVLRHERAQNSLPLLGALRAAAAKHEATPAAIALAWATGHGPVVVIPGATTIEQLEANVAAGDITLDPGEVEALEAAADQVRHPTI